MSLAIDVDKITGVLLADGWHKVRWHKNSEGIRISSFDLDAYEYLQCHPDPNRDPRMLLEGGVVEGIPSTGATWAEDADENLKNYHWYYCPVTAILAVRTDPRPNK